MKKILSCLITIIFIFIFSNVIYTKSKEIELNDDVAEMGFHYIRSGKLIYGIRLNESSEKIEKQMVTEKKVLFNFELTEKGGAFRFKNTETIKMESDGIDPYYILLGEIDITPDIQMNKNGKIKFIDFGQYKQKMLENLDKASDKYAQKIVLKVRNLLISDEFENNMQNYYEDLWHFIFVFWKSKSFESDKKYLPSDTSIFPIISDNKIKRHWEISKIIEAKRSDQYSSKLRLRRFANPKDLYHELASKDHLTENEFLDKKYKILTTDEIESEIRKFKPFNFKRTKLITLPQISITEEFSMKFLYNK